jgi:pyruvate kinase
MVSVSRDRARPNGHALRMTPHELLLSLLALRESALDAARERQADLDAVPLERRASGANLLHYLGVRRVDFRAEQRELSRLGLTSLGRAEAHVLATLDAVIQRLAAEVGEAGIPRNLGHVGVTRDQAAGLLAHHTLEVFGPSPARHPTRIMATLPSEAATEPALVRRLVDAGMGIARINCAHDDPAAWHAMAANVRAVADATGRVLRIAFDLPGPKLRTGPIEPGPAVLRIRPRRDDYGRVVEPATVRLVVAASFGDGTSNDAPADHGVVPVAAELLADATPGDTLMLVDARSRKRRLLVTAVDADQMLAVGDRTTYLTPGDRRSPRAPPRR